jgi:hypothetical protein
VPPQTPTTGFGNVSALGGEGFLLRSITIAEIPAIARARPTPKAAPNLNLPAEFIVDQNGS